MRKRTLEARRSVGGGDLTVPPKQRENDEDSEEITDRARLDD